MSGIRTLGSDLHTGKRSVAFVGRAKLWLTIAAIAVLACLAAPFLRGGLNLGIEFTGGSEFTVSAPSSQDQALATQVVAAHSAAPARVSALGDGAMRVQTDATDAATTSAIRDELAAAYGASPENVAVSTIGPSWGADITRQMLIGLGIFLALAAILMAAYFRTWKISLAAILALFHDLILTVGIYAMTGFEVTPATVIGFLTILGYSLYDTIVVFDRIRENTDVHGPDQSRTFAELVNLAINQTLVRSINTSVVALLPVAAILFIGAFIMGAGTLRDISLALFIGILVGAVSTIFVAAPLYAVLRSREVGIRRIDRKVRIRRGEDEAEAIAKTGGERLAEEDAAPKRAPRREQPIEPILPGPASDADDERPWELEEAEAEEAEQDAAAGRGSRRRGKTVLEAEPSEAEVEAADEDADPELVEGPSEDEPEDADGTADDSADPIDASDATDASDVDASDVEGDDGEQAEPAPAAARGATSSKRRRRRR